MSLPTRFEHLHLLLMKEDFAWVTVSPDWLIAAQGDTPEEAIINWVSTLHAELEITKEHPDHEIPKGRYFDRLLFNASPAYKTYRDIPDIGALDVRGNTAGGKPPEQALHTIKTSVWTDLAVKNAMDVCEFFWTGFMSQWHRSTFTVEDTTYPTAEHYMMASKARLFDDADALKMILAAEHPADVKIAGREIKNFSELTWASRRYHIVFCGSYAKFSQDPDLKAQLLATGDRILVEASPSDKIWGVGLAAENPVIQNPANWNGLNLLGFALMDVRNILRQEAQNA